MIQKVLLLLVHVSKRKAFIVTGIRKIKGIDYCNLYEVCLIFRIDIGLNEGLVGRGKQRRRFGYAPYTDWNRYGGNLHLITMAWAKSNKMGCFVKTDCRYPYSGENMIYVVCQYKVRGNWIGEAVMEVGPACSKGPSGTTCHQKSGFCVSA
ncbi:hypothetical protein AB6A40_008993 [Gnathostoma spinigerum]|uniref:SCP domain-containing protein n=1 Tax=Gnathostoma spinigerum TaxID=75299 RepID=A0ABD6EVR9_9BILA